MHLTVSGRRLVELLIATAVIYLIALGVHYKAHAQFTQSTLQVIAANSSDVAAATAAATLTPGANETAYVCGFVITGAGATSASVITVTITNLVNGTLSFDFPVVAGATTNLAMIPQNFDPCLPAAAINTGIVVSAPSLGTGNLHARMTAWGFTKTQ